MMNQLPTDTRLELIRQVRNTYNRNMYDLSNRERLLYGRQTMRKYDYPAEGTNSYNLNSYDANAGYELFPDHQVSGSSGNFFKIRVAAGLLLFFLLFALDSRGFEIAGHTADEIFEAISYDFMENFDELLKEQLKNADLQFSIEKKEPAPQRLASSVIISSHEISFSAINTII